MDISIAGWSIHRRFQAKTNSLLLLDYPKVAAEEFGIHLIELNSPFFIYEDPDNPSTSSISGNYLKELKRRADDVDVGCLNIAVDSHGDLGSINEAERVQSVENHKKWIDVCVALGCNSFRANSGGRGDGDDETKIEQCIKSFTELSELSGQAGIRLMMENHGGISYDPDVMVRIMETVNSDYCTILADFLNWPPGDDRLENLRKVAPYSWAIHGKFLTFDENGESPDIDCGGAVQILKDANYSNPWGIEYEGKTDDHEGVIKSKALLEKYLGR
ncbi:MAG: sugar phosphate isomerase/epimerase family protein [Candidatus Latescibacterota bacterium]|nr:sugar phosphate isomerase/epimerase family protein [Candidatus Latescibacterota bacterium]